MTSFDISQHLPRGDVAIDCSEVLQMLKTDQLGKEWISESRSWMLLIPISKEGNLSLSLYSPPELDRLFIGQLNATVESKQ